MIKFDKLPVEIQEKMLEYQVDQGNPRDPDVFRKDPTTSGYNSSGFSWDDSSEGFTFWSRIIKVGDFDLFFQKYPKKEFTLPKNWHVVVTEENQKEIQGWMGESIPISDIVGMSNNNNHPTYSGSVPGTVRDKEGYWDFGQEISTEQFRKYVLKEEDVEEKTFPRIMSTWDMDENYTQQHEVHGYLPTLTHPWIGVSNRWRHARELDEAPQPVYLTLQDIYEGKGVGVDPKLIRIKE